MKTPSAILFSALLLIPAAGCNLRGADLGAATATPTSSSDSLDFGGAEIRAIYGNALVTTFAGTAGFGGHVDGIGPLARLVGPSGMGTDGVNVYFTESGSHTLRSLDPASMMVSTLGGTAFSPGDSASQMRFPADVIISGGVLYVSESMNHDVATIFPPVRVVAAGDSDIVGGFLDGAAAVARFYGPAGLVMVGTNLYVADANNRLIRRFDTVTGMVSTFAGKLGVSGTQDGPATAATFAGPSALESDGTYLYVGDGQGFKIRRIEISTGIVDTLSGVGGLNGHVDGTATEAQFGQVRDLALSGGNLYVADLTNQAVRKVSTATGEVTTVAGRRDRGGCVNGAGSVAEFAYPAGLAIAGGVMFVTDPGNYVIRKITGF